MRKKVRGGTNKRSRRFTETLQPSDLSRRSESAEGAQYITIFERLSLSLSLYVCVLLRQNWPWPIVGFDSRAAAPYIYTEQSASSLLPSNASSAGASTLPESQRVRGEEGKKGSWRVQTTLALCYTFRDFMRITTLSHLCTYTHTRTHTCGGQRGIIKGLTLMGSTTRFSPLVSTSTSPRAVAANWWMALRARARACESVLEYTTRARSRSASPTGARERIYTAWWIR